MKKQPESTVHEAQSILALERLRGLLTEAWEPPSVTVVAPNFRTACLLPSTPTAADLTAGSVEGDSQPPSCRSLTHAEGQTCVCSWKSDS